MFLPFIGWSAEVRGAYNNKGEDKQYWAQEV